MNVSEAMFYENFDIGFLYKRCYFKPVCLLVKMASKTVIRPITWYPTWLQKHLLYGRMPVTKYHVVKSQLPQFSIGQERELIQCNWSRRCCANFFQEL